ncbi:MAG: hypothetical protein HQM15_10075 [Deltaproteobacteria bacterium]|nr:hypothetical protein [Deltaproteobacteria bacterium]
MPEMWGGEVITTNLLTWIGVSLGLEQEQILQASGIYGFAANAIDELGGGVTNHFNVVNLMNVGALGAAALPLSPSIAPTGSLAVARDDKKSPIHLPVYQPTSLQSAPASNHSILEQVYQFTSLRVYGFLQNMSDFLQDLLFSQAFLFMGMGGVGTPGERPKRKNERRNTASEISASSTVPLGSRENPLPIRVEMEIPKKMGEEHINAIVRAIVAQDAELYPQASAAVMSTSPRYFQERWYRVGEEDLKLLTLAGRVRQARGFKAYDTKTLPPSSLVQEWKEKLFGISKSSRSQVVLAGDFQFQDPRKWTEAEIDRVVRAIVVQDAELYPQASAAAMSTSEKYFKDRWYRVGEEDLTLDTLVRRVRQARGFKAGDTKSLSASSLVQEWKERLFNLQSFEEMSEESLGEYIAAQHLQEVLDLFSSDTLLLREMLSLLKPEVFQHNDVDKFIQVYVGLQVASEKSAKIQREEVDNWEMRRRYLAALAKALDENAAIDLSEESFQHQLDLFIRLSRTSYQENPEQFILQLQESINNSGHPFIKRLQEETLKYFKADEDFELKNMRSKASSYQKEGARFLTTHSLVILGDEAGMGKSYQAIAAVEHLGLKRVLWVTTASNKENIKREIRTHACVSEKDIRVVISGDPKMRSEQLQALNGERYRITNYETLVALQKNDPVGYAKLTEGLDVIVVDEAQMTDNAETLRQNAIAGISTPRKWLLTATPYQSKPEKFWTLLNYLDEKRYPDFQAFKNLYCQSSRGLELLHTELRRYLLRRTKRHTLLNFKDPSEVSFEEQLKNDALRLPRFERLDPKIWGHYDLSSEQSDLIAWMIADYRGWAEVFNENLPAAAELIDLNNINPLEKFETIHKVIYTPEYFGITTPNPMYEKLDARVREKIARGEKVILWAWNTEVLDVLERRFSDLSPHPNPLPQGERGRSVVRIDGTVTGTAREKAIQAFQNDPDAKILVANFVSGGVGLTLTAATTAIAMQLPLQYSLMYQMEGRHHRLIGLNNIQHAKYAVGMEYLIPQYPAEFLKELSNDKLRNLMRSGTLVEQSFARLMGAELLYRLVMEGYGDPEKLDAYFKQGLLKNLCLTGSEKLDYTGHLKGRVRQEIEVVQALLPLWNMFAGSEEAQDQVLRLIEAYLHYPEQAKALDAVFEKATQAYPEDLKIILSLFEFKNKHIREQLLKRLPGLMIELYTKGQSLQSVASGLKMNRLNPANLIALMYMKAGLGSETVIAIARQIAEQRDTPRRCYLEEHYVMGIFGLMGVEESRALLDKIGPLFEDMKLEEAVHVLYRLGLLARCGKEVLTEVTLSLTLSPQGRGEPGEEFVKFNTQFEKLFYTAMGNCFAVTSEKVHAQVRQNPNWFGSADTVLALILGWQEYDNKEAVEKFQEAMMQVFEGKHKEWRLRNGALGFLDEEEEGEAYWERFAEDTRSEIPNLVIEAAETQKVSARMTGSLEFA